MIMEKNIPEVHSEEEYLKGKNPFPCITFLLLLMYDSKFF